MALSLISANKYLQFISLPSDIDPDTYINEYSLKNFLSILKNPEPLSHFIFNQSIKSVSLNKVDEKISYDKYLDDLIDTIKDKKSQYFYKNEFKSLFFNNIRTKGKNIPQHKLSNSKPQKKLNKIQNLSFIATILNHPSVRNEILIEFLKSDIFNEDEKLLLNELKKERFNKLENKEILKILDNQTYIQIVNHSLTSKIYKLFPYSSPNYDPQLSRDEALNSLKNLNTRLLNLQKINKSLDTFIKESNQLNWEDLQKINIEITNED
jgi:DNA primase